MANVDFFFIFSLGVWINSMQLSTITLPQMSTLWRILEV